MQLGSTDLFQKLTRQIDHSHQAVVVNELDVPSGFWSKCRALERRCYWGAQLQAARGVTCALFMTVGGYDSEISSGDDFYISRRYYEHAAVPISDDLLIPDHQGYATLVGLVLKKFLYVRTARGSLVKRQAERRAISLVGARLAAYVSYWRFLREDPWHYLGIFPLRALEFIAVTFGMLVGVRSEKL